LTEIQAELYLQERLLQDLDFFQILLKPENLQKTGSFKIRGAYNKISNLTDAERKRGVIASSAGNHAQGVAYAAKESGIKAVIVMPKSTPLIKVESTKQYGAEVILYGDVYDDAYKKAFDEYTPDVTAQIIRLDNEDKAKEILEKAKASDADFAQLAKDNSTDEKTKANGGEITFDSASTELPEQVKKAAFALDVNGVSDVITAAGTQAYSSQYYIVKLIKKTEKSSNIDDYKEKLKTVILTQKQNDSTFVQSIIGKELQAANIKVKDQAFQNIFTQYIGGGDSSSSSSSKE